jgi:HEAT repeat protein
VNIYWPLRALTEIGGDEAAVDTLLDALNGINDRFDRSMERMTNLVSCFRDYDHPAVLDKLIELVTDDSEEVRFLSVDGLTTFAEHSKAVDAIMERLIDDDETGRVKTYIMDTLIENRWNVKKYKKQLADKLPESYFVDDTGVIQRRY